MTFRYVSKKKNWFSITFIELFLLSVGLVRVLLPLSLMGIA